MEHKMKHKNEMWFEFDKGLYNVVHPSVQVD